MTVKRTLYDFLILMIVVGLIFCLLKIRSLNEQAEMQRLQRTIIELKANIDTLEYVQRSVELRIKRLKNEKYKKVDFRGVNNDSLRRLLTADTGTLRSLFDTGRGGKAH